MGFFSDLTTDLYEEARTDSQNDSARLSAISTAEKRDDARQQAEEDAAKVVLSQLAEESNSPETDADTGTDVEMDAETDAETGSEANAEAVTEDEKQAAEDRKRREHEEAEVKRKAEWEAKKKAQDEAEQAAWENAVAMNDDEIMSASMKRVGDDAERLTRRNMKACVAEHIQTRCLEDADFARQAMHPRKNMINCFRYISRKAREFIEQEMKDNDEKPLTNGVYGGDVPDDLCYKWAEEYFMDLEAEEDKKEDEKFVPKPYIGTYTSRSKKKPEKKKPEPKKAAPAAAKPAKEATEQQTLFSSDQISLLDVVQKVSA